MGDEPSVASGPLPDVILPVAQRGRVRWAINSDADYEIEAVLRLRCVVHLDALTVALSDGTGLAAMVYPGLFKLAAGCAPGTVRMSSQCQDRLGPTSYTLCRSESPTREDSLPRSCPGDLEPARPYRVG